MLNKEYISRMLRYSNVLNKLKTLGLMKVFSDNIGDAAGVSSSQVRKDFAALKITGNKRGGYKVDDLVSRLESILGKNEDKKAIVVGCGNIGKALMNYKAFVKDGLRIVAGFDVDPDVSKTNVATPIYPLEEMEKYIQANSIKVGVIAVPESAAAEIYEKMVAAGIKGVLNFARVHLREVDGCVVNTINIELKIENLFYFVNALEN